jgi:hypothetical protein
MNVAFRRVHQSGLLRRSVNEENITLKLTLILSSSLALVSTECSSTTERCQRRQPNVRGFHPSVAGLHHGSTHLTKAG